MGAVKANEPLVVSVDLKGMPNVDKKQKVSLVEVLSPVTSTNASDNNEETSQSEAQVPKEFRLSAYPNPFNPSTKIQIDLPSSGFVKLVVYDVLGRIETRLKDAPMCAGYHTVVWDGRNFASGMYFARMIVTDASGRSIFNKTNKLLLTK